MDSETVHIREIETVASHKGKLLRVTFEQRRRNGEIQRREREVYDNGDSAVILPHDPHRNTVLLTRQLRLPIFLRDGTERTLEACAGKLDGALAERRIVKEMEEELGYQIAKVQRLFDLYVSPAAIMERSSRVSTRRQTGSPRVAGSRRRARISKWSRSRSWRRLPWLQPVKSSMQKPSFSFSI